MAANAPINSSSASNEPVIISKAEPDKSPVLVATPLINQAGRSIRIGGNQLALGYVCSILGPAVAIIGSTVKETKTDASTGIETTTTGSKPALIAGGVISVVGLICLLSGSGNIAKGGRLLESITDGKLSLNTQYGTGICFKF